MKTEIMLTSQRTDQEWASSMMASFSQYVLNFSHALPIAYVSDVLAVKFKFSHQLLWRKTASWLCVSLSHTLIFIFRKPLHTEPLTLDSW